ncbi:MAG: hypothetical protein RR355_03690 [Oscillospiraceae bacterium]
MENLDVKIAQRLFDLSLLLCATLMMRVRFDYFYEILVNFGFVVLLPFCCLLWVKREKKLVKGKRKIIGDKKLCNISSVLAFIADLLIWIGIFIFPNIVVIFSGIAIFLLSLEVYDNSLLANKIIRTRKISKQ